MLFYTGVVLVLSCVALELCRVVLVLSCLVLCMSDLPERLVGIKGELIFSIALGTIVSPDIVSSNMHLRQSTCLFCLIFIYLYYI